MAPRTFAEVMRALNEKRERDAAYIAQRKSAKESRERDMERVRVNEEQARIVRKALERIERDRERAEQKSAKDRSNAERKARREQARAELAYKRAEQQQARKSRAVQKSDRAEYFRQWHAKRNAARHEEVRAINQGIHQQLRAKAEPRKSKGMTGREFREWKERDDARFRELAGPLAK